MVFTLDGVLRRERESWTVESSYNTTDGQPENPSLTATGEWASEAELAWGQVGMAHDAAHCDIPASAHGCHVHPIMSRQSPTVHCAEILHSAFGCSNVPDRPFGVDTQSRSSANE
jgi:hypothetical protein